MKLVLRWAQVAASEARICQVRVPLRVLLPQEILRAITAGRSWRPECSECVDALWSSHCNGHLNLFSGLSDHFVVVGAEISRSSIDFDLLQLPVNANGDS
jgi:hypothetical protein